MKKAIASIRMVAAPIECNTKHGVPYTQRKCTRCGTCVDNEHHMLFECRQPALAVSRSDHSILFDGISDVRKLMAVAYKPELATILGSCMQGMLHGLETGPERGRPVKRHTGFRCNK